ncbi:HIT domain-containing protein [Plectosphaerella plurivora]|uniref:Adenosine 5'-monophosphoramidase HNT1 n=1 Tax=Plectosphaerella plurivora TaxID=936078 RepID=A0A9P8V2F4_9PEZI|nr:HIT domain-containing protein [Plectosphaerella plurivora]
MAHSLASCIFCKIIKGNLLTPPTGEIPSFKLFESERTFAFLDINPLSRGHALVIPKYHGEKILDIPDEDLQEILPVVKKLVKATGATEYNVLQNNGPTAHQVVQHVHFHMIPKPNETEGLGVGWPQQKTDMDKLKALFEDIKSKM